MAGRVHSFEARIPISKVTFAPTAPTAYDAALNAKLEAGTAGDLITCRPFDLALKLFNAGRFVDLTSMPGMENFGPAARTAWTTDDGKNTFCVPINSTISGFIYNKNIFQELGLQDPTTEDEFFALLEKIKAGGKYVPLATGTADQWETTTMGYDNIGPNYWRGEEGRKAVIAGTQKLTDEPWVARRCTLKRWADYMGDGFEARSYRTARTCSRSAARRSSRRGLGRFRSSRSRATSRWTPSARRCPRRETRASSRPSRHGHGRQRRLLRTKEAATKFVGWMATPEFAQLLVGALPGFYSLSNHDVKIDNPLAAKFLTWRKDCTRPSATPTRSCARHADPRKRDLARDVERDQQD